MRNVFHYHITIEGITTYELKVLAKELKAKPTTIDLYTDIRNQRDRMVTKYSNSFRDIRAAMFKDVEYVKEAGFKVIRAKIEQVTDKFTFSNYALYSEAHIKVVDGPLPDIENLHLSSNPVEGRRFYNARAYSSEEFEAAVGALDMVEDPISEQYEVCLFDSNMAHDDWWTDGT